MANCSPFSSLTPSPLSNFPLPTKLHHHPLFSPSFSSLSSSISSSNHCQFFSIQCRNTQRRRFPVFSNIEGNSEEFEDDEVDNLGVKSALTILRFYKREISPLLPKSCRYVPTCSEYSRIAYKKYGFAKGTVLTAWRICRCNPLGGSGFDPPRWFGEERASDSED